MDADRKRAMITGLRRAGRESAEARRCPDCQRKSATKQTVVHFDDGDFVIHTECRWCGYVRETSRYGETVEKHGKTS